MALNATALRRIQQQSENLPWSPSRDEWWDLRLAANAADVSPLRYPGGKRKLAVLVAQIFALAKVRPRLLVEPFAGGAAVSIALLEAGFVEEIALADADEMVAAFWKVVFSDDAELLARRVEKANVTLKERKRIAASRPRSVIGLAFKCLFLNRTSFSGILNETAGPIGGKTQRGKYRIGCRFNKERIAERIRALSKLRNRVRFVRCQGYEQTIVDCLGLDITRADANSVFWYFDPPFFEKAPKLYRKTFDDEAHRTFKEWLTRVPGHFVLSYDDVEESEELYGNDKRLMRFGLQYVMNANDEERPKVKEIIISDLTATFRAKMTVYHKTRSILSGRVPARKRSANPSNPKHAQRTGVIPK